MKSKKIVIIGGGNVAYHLIKSITASGHKLLQIYNRTLSNIQMHSSNSNLIGNIGELSPDGDIYIVCVKDDAIESMANKFNLKDKLVVHTSGNRSKELLQATSSNYGIFYPIQTFTKNVPIDFKNIPIVVEGNNAESTLLIKDFASSISNHVYELDETKRQYLNIAGVFVNNFTNALFASMDSFLKTKEVDFKILLPLIQNTVDKLKLDTPHKMQTGPAVRKDMDTIARQQDMLTDYPDLHQIYQLMTDMILKQHA